ncbi:hypothetical protein GW17_00024477 [Ensete ventricosum]|nr:hypothetical protein GW17_00024477 [Ensete ventricosum]
MISNAQPEITTPSPTVSASWKRQKSSQSIPSLTLGAPSPALHSQLAAAMQPSLSAAKIGAAAGTKAKKPKSIASASSAKSMHYPSAGLSGRGQIANENYCGAVAAGEAA